MVGGSSAQFAIVAPDCLLYGAVIVAVMAVVALAFVLMGKK
jgi:hypothetical protein